MIDKRRLLIDLINECKIEDFSIIGNLNDSINKDNLQYILFKMGFKDINIYFYPANDKITNICCITLKNILSEEDLIKIESIFKIIYNYYQVELSEDIINIIFGTSNENINLKTLFELLNISNKEVAELIFKSKQTVTDIVKGRTNITISSLSILMRKFPLMPWDYYLLGVY